MSSIPEGAVTQDQSFSSNCGELDFLSKSVFSVFPSLALTVIAAALPFLLGAWKVIWPTLRTVCLERRHAEEIIRTISGTYRRVTRENRWDQPISDHSGILLNAVLLRIVAIMENNSELAQDSMWHDKPSVLFLFDPLRSDSFLVLGGKSFERIDNYWNNLAWRLFQFRKRLHSYTVLRLPTAGTWIPLCDGIEVTYQRQRLLETTAYVVEHRLHLRTTGEDGLTRLERFVHKSIQDYTTKLPCIAGNQRYYFQLHVTDGEKGPIRFKQSPLPPSRAFDRLFFPQKITILALVDSFLEKRGRFSVEGFPYKLGFFLYGPSGTGKTSFVAALAAYTGRHVISVHLPYITTNKELQSIFLQQELLCCGHSETFKFDFDDVIFLLDDVHPTEDLVRRRVPAETKSEKDTPLFRNCSPSDALSPTMEWRGSDAANLSGLLNALDGVVDTPGRIVVMTTRHPEGFDPALLRAGRFGHHLRMEYMRVAELIELLGLHFGDELQPVESTQLATLNYSMDRVTTSKETVGRRQLSEVVIKKVSRCVSAVEAKLGGEFSIRPSEAESMCLTAATIDEFIDQLCFRHGVNGQDGNRPVSFLSTEFTVQL